MKTKDKILETSLMLFNEFGVESVTLRQIAGELGISHGNLCYHYANKERIISVLYIQMQDRISEQYNTVDFATKEVLGGIEFLENMFEICFSYRFILFNSYEIINRVPEVKKLQEDTVVERRNNLAILFKTLAKEKLLKRSLKDKNIELLTIQINLISDFWIPYAEYSTDFDKEKIKGFYIDLIVQTLLPYLSIKGKLQLAKYGG